MTELEQTLLPQMDEYMTPWMRYVDDTVAAIHPDHVKNALKTLNSFNKRIQFTHEIEKDCTLPFLDVKLIRKEQHVDTTVYRKPTTSNIYLHWHSFAPKSWKISTLKSMILRAYKICSNDVYRNQELKNISEIFTTINGYPQWLIKDLYSKIEEGVVNERVDETNVDRPTLIILPYKGTRGEKVLKSMRKSLKNNNIQSKVVFQGTKLSDKLNIKDQIKKEHQHNLVYIVNCPSQACAQTYIGETARRLTSRLEEHSGKSEQSNVTRHSIDSGHSLVQLSNFKILTQIQSKDTNTRKIAEALLIQKHKPTLNTQGASVQLKLF